MLNVQEEQIEEIIFPASPASLLPAFRGPCADESCRRVQPQQLRLATLLAQLQTPFAPGGLFSFQSCQARRASRHPCAKQAWLN